MNRDMSRIEPVIPRHSSRLGPKWTAERPEVDIVSPKRDMLRECRKWRLVRPLRAIQRIFGLTVFAFRDGSLLDCYHSLG